MSCLPPETVHQKTPRSANSSCSITYDGTALEGTRPTSALVRLDLLQRVSHRVADFVNLFVGVHGGDGGADEIFSRGHGRGNGHDGEDIFLAQRPPEHVNAFLRA